MKLRILGLLGVILMSTANSSCIFSRSIEKALGRLVIALGMTLHPSTSGKSLSIEKFLSMVKPTSQVTVKELVAGYDALLHVHKDGADKALEVYRKTTIEKLRKELAAATQGSNGAPQTEDEDEDWGI